MRVSLTRITRPYNDSYRISRHGIRIRCTLGKNLHFLTVSLDCLRTLNYVSLHVVYVMGDQKWIILDAKALEFC
jgi:hypothetical protein